LDYVEINNLVDKQRLVAASYYAKEGKESVNFAFPFALPEARTRLDVSFGVVRPNQDQIASACKNWFTVGTVGRWADMSNRQAGVTWVTLDAPLVELGAVTATLLNSQTNPTAWLKRVEPRSVLYSWAMNNHWHTNYRAYQEGPVPFRFVLRPHQPSADAICDAAATRLAMDLSQPLLVTRGRGAAADGQPRLSVDGSGSLLAALKPSDDGRALIVRLWGTAPQAGPSHITWGSPSPRKVFLSDLSERPLQEAGPSIDVPLHGVVTLRAELD
jgi:alpha-mannosidase